MTQPDRTAPEPTSPFEDAFEIDAKLGEFEAGWKAGNRPSIADHLPPASGHGKHESASQADLFRQLLEIELHWRFRAGERPDRESYRDRFPQFTAEIESAFRTAEPDSSDAPNTSSVAGSEPNQRDAPAEIALTQTASGINEDTSEQDFSHGGRDPEQTATPARIGRYSIVGRIGEGGQGDIFRALHPNLPVDLAIKISNRPADPSRRDLLRKEAQILCQLDHPHIARVRDCDFHDGKPFLVLDYIRGQSLRTLLQTGQATQATEIGWLRDVALAIDHAHRRGVLHLDLKPDNIVIDENNQAKVIDFGLARMRDAYHDPDQERDGISGTLQYMAPEQATGKASSIDARADIFALGGILYRILTGEPPFSGSTTSELLRNAQRCQFDRNRLLDADVDPSLREACLRAMSLDPQERFATAGEFAEAIATDPKKTNLVSWLFSSNVRRIAGVVVTAGLVCLAFVFLGPRTSLPPLSSDADASSLTAADPSGSPIQEFTITHIGNRDDRAIFAGPLFQHPSPREYDDLQVRARFDQPVYAYLFALNPDGSVQLCYPDRPDEPPSEPIEQLRFPSDEALAFGLTDGAGYQAFVLVADIDPLPASDQWKSMLTDLSWPLPDLTGNWWYRDGQLEPKNFASAIPRGDVGNTRGAIRPTKEPAEFKRLLDTITHRGEALQSVIFEVQPKADSPQL